jgi:hypothetical protein
LLLEGDLNIDGEEIKKVKIVLELKTGKSNKFSYNA